MSHRLHPDIGLNGLADKCPDCKAISEAPMDWLTPMILQGLWMRMVAFEYRQDHDARPRSDNEARAMKNLWFAARILRKAGMSTRNLDRVFDPGTVPVVLTDPERSAIYTLFEGVEDEYPLAASVLAAVGGSNVH